MKDKQPLTHRTRRIAKRLVKKQPNSTRAFTVTDYDNLPKGDNA
jgi:hypothetical protein